MKTKLTLYVEQSVVHDAKIYARKRGIPVSVLVEEHLRSLASEKRASFAANWRGKFAFPPLKDARLSAIAEKHLR